MRARYGMSFASFVPIYVSPQSLQCHMYYHAIMDRVVTTSDSTSQSTVGTFLITLSSPASEINGKSAATVPKIVHKPLKHIYGKGQRQNSSVNIQNFVSGDYRNVASLRLKNIFTVMKMTPGKQDIVIMNFEEWVIIPSLLLIMFRYCRMYTPPNKMQIPKVWDKLRALLTLPNIQDHKSWTSIHWAEGRLIAKSVPIALKFDRYLGSSVVEMTIKSHSDTIIITSNLATSKLDEVWW